jgi:hypothetical protein
MTRGALRAIVAVGVVSAAVAPNLIAAHASTRIAGLLAQIGAAFLIAYGVEMAWVTQVTVVRNASYEDWIGGRVVITRPLAPAREDEFAVSSAMRS